jgi:hypothetical protein
MEVNMPGTLLALAYREASQSWKLSRVGSKLLAGKWLKQKEAQIDSN